MLRFKIHRSIFQNQTVGGSSYYWIFDTINNLGESYDENPNFVFPSQVADNYFVQLLATNVFGCQKSVTQLLIVRENQTFYVPNSFTPNGDGDNDYFFVQGVELDPNVFALIVYDRWGAKVFESTTFMVNGMVRLMEVITMRRPEYMFTM